MKLADTLSNVVGGAVDVMSQDNLLAAGDVVNSAIAAALSGTGTLSASAGRSLIGSVASIAGGIPSSEGGSVENGAALASAMTSTTDSLGDALSANLSPDDPPLRVTSDGLELMVQKVDTSKSAETGFTAGDGKTSIPSDAFGAFADAAAARRLQTAKLRVLIDGTDFNMSMCESDPAVNIQTTDWLGTNPYRYAGANQSGDMDILDNADVKTLQMRACSQKIPVNDLDENNMIIGVPNDTSHLNNTGFPDPPSCGECMEECTDEGEETPAAWYNFAEPCPSEGYDECNKCRDDCIAFFGCAQWVNKTSCDQIEGTDDCYTLVPRCAYFDDKTHKWSNDGIMEPEYHYDEDGQLVADGDML